MLFRSHLKSIFIAGTFWKVTQVKMKFTLLTFVKSEEDDPLGPTPLDIYLLYYLLRGLSQCFLLLGRVIIKEWGFKPNAKAQVLTPTIYIINCTGNNEKQEMPSFINKIKVTPKSSLQCKAK